ncbi:2TM domain-containing protein [Pseudolysinimonas sp.]
MSDADDLRAAARANLKRRNDFHQMLVIFGVITVLLLAIWFFSTGQPSNFTAYFWPVWPIIGMTIAAVFAGLDAYGITRRHITETDVDAEVARMTARRDGTPPAV